MDPVTNYCEAILGDNQEAKSAIRLIPEFRLCTDPLLDMVYRYSKTVDIEPGEKLITQGLFDQWVYFIIEGELDVYFDGKSLGTTSGPMVGERCILGEPRGADLISGQNGLLALGVEMSIIDEVNREVNDFARDTKDEDAIAEFTDKRLSIALEILSIILQEVISRIVNLHDSGVDLIKQIKTSDSDLDIEMQSLFGFQANDSSTPKEKDAQKTKFTGYNFDDFADIVYFELLQKHLSEHGYEGFKQAEWQSVFKLDDASQIHLTPMFQWLGDSFGLSVSKLIDVTYSIYDVASQYTAASNKSLNAIVSFMGTRGRIKDEASDPQAESRRQESVSVLIEKLFNPIKEKSQTPEKASDSQKLSQADIDSLFD